MKIIQVVGARPNFIKVAPILEAIKRRNERGGNPKIHSVLVHTGQHYDHAMSQSFFDDLCLPRPDINLEVGSGSHAGQTGKIMMAFEPVLEEERPDLVLVVGDVNSTLACALTAKKLNIPVAHIEAGLRSGDMTMPEEVNRRVADAISDYLFTTDPIADTNLQKEGVPSDRIFFVGNVMIDTLLKHRKRAEGSKVLDILGLRNGNGSKPYAVITLHRPSNVDDPLALRDICEALQAISRQIPIIFPCHPRTRGRIDEFDLEGFFDGEGKWIKLTAPLGYLDFLHLNANASLILTDSGGIQEEATILGVPCLTLRYNTERPITITQGTNRLVGNRKQTILEGFDWAVQQIGKPAVKPDKWDGRTAERIVDILAGIPCSRSREESLTPLLLDLRHHLLS
jgi:UDP-N-acetylglucosamine 2-epimerase (non-hydrolysing)